MTTRDEDEELLGRDWGGDWDNLPDAPPLVARQKAAQVTLRLPPALVADAKRIGALRHIPYHTLVRGWILDDRLNVDSIVDAGPSTSQVNIKLTAEDLDSLKRAADRVRRPYHGLARDRIAEAVSQEKAALRPYPEYAEHSLIGHQVAERARKPDD